MNWLKMASIRIIVVSMICYVYVCSVVVPFANRYGFFSGASSPPADRTTLYFLMTTPIFIAYIILVIFNLFRLESLRSIVFPLIVFSLYSGFFGSLMVMGGTILWLAVFGFPLFFVALIASVIIGVVMDIRNKKSNNSKVLFCRNCGNQLPYSAGFCTNCGTSIS
ncbi:MAG: zinc ribbon domain-containing protein [Dehalococcoidia bacterium]|nr:zinc ribbon domain-containing protein [Dehalococcoidia bacterium]